jgi:hypothetical protein
MTYLSDADLIEQGKSEPLVICNIRGTCMKMPACKGIVSRELMLLAGVQTIVAAITIGFLLLPRSSPAIDYSDQDAQALGEMAEQFHRDHRRWPQRNGGVWELAAYGYIDYRSNRRAYQRMSDSFEWDRSTIGFRPKP